MEVGLEEKYGGEYICTSCGYIGESKTKTRGSFLIEIILWFFFLIPGLIYTVWRLTSKHSACPKCANPTMIPIDTPKGKGLIKSLDIKPVEVIKEESTENKKGPKITFVGFLVIVFTIMSFIWIGSFSSKDSGGANQTQQNQQQIVTKQGKFLEHNYTIVQKQEENKYIATFTPFLPRNDTIIKGIMFEVIKQIYGKNTVRDLQPKIIERDGQNLLLLEGVKTDYIFLLVKEDTGEVHSFVFWNE